MRKRTSNGFTLIELLVVIAIIGVLSSIVLSSLNRARERGDDAGIEQQLSDMRTSAEVQYDSDGTYDSVCDLTTSSGKLFLAALSLNTEYPASCFSSGRFTIMVTNKGELLWGNYKKVTSGTWAASVPLKTGGYFCVDSTGVATTTSTAPPLDVNGNSSHC